MTSIKTVLLGSAASIVAVGAAQAADLPVKKAAAAVQYVEACPAYGKGFYKLPGTNICVKYFGLMKFIGGWWDPGGDVVRESRPERVIEKKTMDKVGWEWSVRPGWDFRAPTEFGTLRSVVQIRGDERSGIFERRGLRLAGGTAGPQSNVGGTHAVGIYRGYIEWAGFIVGRTGSQFDYWGADDMISSFGGSPQSDSTTTLTYVWSLPGGVQATIGLEDTETFQGHVRKVSGIQSNPQPSISTISDQGPKRAYDIVATLSTEQSWGSAKIAGAAHRISVITNSFTGQDCTYAPGGAKSGSCPSKQTWGWAALAGITLNLPQLGKGDQITIEGTYANGAIAYAGVNGGGDVNPGSGERVGQWTGGLVRANDSDAFLVNNGDGTFKLEKEKAYSIVGQLRHYWTPMLRSNLAVGKTWLRPPDDIHFPRITAGGLGDADVLDVSANLIWGKKRETAEIGVEVMYKKVNQDLPTSTTIAGGGNGLPNGIDQNPSAWGVDAIIRRDW
ncbi:MAG TPA: porin [Xanthobacteraceae bacterium]|nr:porin [Xanthobacteraceae bacterium]